MLQKRLWFIFSSLAENGKLDEIMESAKDKTLNSFLIFPERNVFSTASIHSSMFDKKSPGIV